jgi:D-glycero-alpha-D-manno-heptose-7-phosphate kinase
MIITKTPYRISFFGGGTDYPTWCNNYGGQVLSTSIDKYCYISFRDLPPFFDHKYRLVYSKIENVTELKDIEHPVIREALKDHDFHNLGVEIHHDGDLPARSGLGSSSSFAVGLYNAICSYKGNAASKMKLADYAIYLEQELLRENVGFQDQIAVAYGGLNHITFQKGGGYNVSPVEISKSRIKQLESHLLLFFTGTTRFASNIAGEQIKSLNANENKLQNMSKMVDDGINILLDSSINIEEFGRLLHNAWEYKKSLTNSITNNDIDNIYDVGRNAGALGGKLLGAGGGGFILFFAPPDRHYHIKSCLSDLINVPFAFENSGSEVIFNDMKI